MARYTGPKNRLSRREGQDLFGKGAKLRRASVPPGQHGPKGARRASGFGQQLREKQKIRRIFDIMERQFRRYFEKARVVKGATGAVLLRLLETRLDNVVYRLGFAGTRSHARQLTSHGHILVNGQVVDIPSYHVRPGDMVTLDEQTLDNPHVKVRLEDSASPKPPAWLDRRAAIGKVTRLPQREDIDLPVNEQLIVEYYSNR
jgi:small subunit ribosomal protein S4